MEFDEGDMCMDNRGQAMMGDENSLALPSVNENSNSLAMMEC